MKTSSKIFANVFLLTFLVAASSFAQSLPANQDTLVARTIRAVITSTHHPRMKWPEFPYYEDEMRGLYQPLAFQPFWVAGGQPRPQIRDAVDILLAAEERGLDPEDYEARRLEEEAQRLAAGAKFSAEETALFDTQLSLALFRHISDVHIGKLNPNNLGYGINIEPKKYNLPELVRQSVSQNRLREMIRDAEPPYPVYRAFKNALAQYRQLAAAATFALLPNNGSVRPGDPYNGLQQLRGWLHAIGDFGEHYANGDSEVIYQGAIVDAVKRFQSRHGLQADGVLGKSTFAALNVPPARRCRQIEFAMERLRWLPELREGPFIFVNIPAFRLYAFDSLNAQGAPAFALDVIVGKALDTETPVFMENMQYIEFRPYWYVPLSIVRRTILPALQKNPEHLRHNGFDILRGDAVLGQDASPEMIEQLQRGALRLRQQPGPNNALGLAKFIFPNNSNVYIHGTPSLQLFGRARRDLSSGCIRIEDPASLAAWILKDQPRWNRDGVVAAMNGAQPTRVFLTNPLPVVIFYTTAIVRPDGVVFFYEDIYQHDKVLEEALLAGEPYAP